MDMNKYMKESNDAKQTAERLFGTSVDNFCKAFISNKAHLITVKIIQIMS